MRSSDVNGDDDDDDVDDDDICYIEGGGGFRFSCVNRTSGGDALTLHSQSRKNQLATDIQLLTKRGSTRKRWNSASLAQKKYDQREAGYVLIQWKGGLEFLIYDKAYILIIFRRTFSDLWRRKKDLSWLWKKLIQNRIETYL